MFDTILIIGSGPNAISAKSWPKNSFDAIICINNAWQVRPDWDFHIYPDDFPPEKMPPHLKKGQHLIDETHFVPVQNRYGGFVYAGGTMAYTTAYWALGTLHPKQMFFIGCDMHYPKDKPTHFYGTGSPDPLRKDITLTSLEASSARFYCLAHAQGCAVYNLSDGPSRLLFDRARMKGDGQFDKPLASQTPPDRAKMDVILAKEDALGYFVENGRYWESDIDFDEKALRKLDRAWLDASPFDFKAP